MTSKKKSARPAGIPDLKARKLTPSKADEVKGASRIQKKDTDTRNAVISKLG